MTKPALIAAATLALATPAAADAGTMSCPNHRSYNSNDVVNVRAATNLPRPVSPRAPRCFVAESVVYMTLKNAPLRSWSRSRRFRVQAAGWTAGTWTASWRNRASATHFTARHGSQRVTFEIFGDD
jgi:hypothetical protein